MRDGEFVGPAAVEPAPILVTNAQPIDGPLSDLASEHGRGTEYGLHKPAVPRFEVEAPPRLEVSVVVDEAGAFPPSILPD